MKALMILVAAVVFFFCISSASAQDAAAPASKAAPIAKAPAVPASQPASQPTEVSPKDVAEQVGIIVQLFKDKSWRPAVAAIITLIVFLWRRFLGKLLINKIPTKHLGWITALLGLLAAIPSALTTSPFVWYKFLADALLISGPAVLFWTTVGKHVLPAVFGKLPAKPAEPAE